MFNPRRICKQDVKPLEIKAKMLPFIIAFKGYQLGGGVLIACHLHNKNKSLYKDAVSS